MRRATSHSESFGRRRRPLKLLEASVTLDERSDMKILLVGYVLLGGKLALNTARYYFLAAHESRNPPRNGVGMGNRPHVAHPGHRLERRPGQCEPQDLADAPNRRAHFGSEHHKGWRAEETVIGQV